MPIGLKYGILLVAMRFLGRHVVEFFGSKPSHDAEVAHWNEVEQRVSNGERLFWLNHPRIAHHYYRKALIEGLSWREWVVRELDGPAAIAMELGCGNGDALKETLLLGTAVSGIGIDLDVSRFTAEHASRTDIRFVAADLNTVELDPNSSDLIYALQSFHHFEALEHVMEQVNSALTDRGLFVLDEFVGPARFQWTDLQLSIISQMLGLLPKSLRMYTNGVEKRAEGRSTPEEVIRVCPSEAVRSDEIVPLFYRYFDVVYHRNLGGTIQHLLYSGIVHNFADNDAEIDHLVDCIDGLESTLIERGVLPSDFVLLIGRKKS